MLYYALMHTFSYTSWPCNSEPSDGRAPAAMATLLDDQQNK